MADKNFKVKSGLNIPITSAAILTTDSSGNISSTAVLPITAGGTGQTSATNAINALLPVQNGSTINYAIQSDGTNINWGKLYNQTIKNNGTTVTPRGIVNIIGASFSDDSGTDTTTITFTDTTGVSTSGGSTITASSASVKGLIIKGAASQTANLQEWQNSAGSTVASIDPNGNLVANFIGLGLNAGLVAGGSYFLRVNYAAGNTINLGTPAQVTGTQVQVTNSTASNIALTVKAAASQSGDLQQWQNSAGTVLAKVDKDGLFSNTYGARLSTANVAGVAGVSLSVGGQSGALANTVLKNSSGATYDFLQFQNSTGAVLAKIDATGAMFTTTAAVGTNTTQVATTAFVKTAIDNIVDSAPGALDTLNEIAAALNDDPNFYTTITTLTSALENNDVYNYMGVF